MLDSIANLLILVVTLLILGFILAREVIKRWRIGLRITAADESLLTDNSVSVKMITDAPEGSVIVSHVPAMEIKE